MKLHDVIKKPLITEKAVRGKERGEYAFAVAIQANKTDVKRAVETLFKVKVDAVHTLRVPGRAKRVGKHQAMTSDWKKAIVKLKQGQSIELFEGG